MEACKFVEYQELGGLGGLGFFLRKLSAVNLVLCRHADTISDLLFRRLSGFAFAFARAISNFSVVHRSHFRVPHL